jgi:hypothetical protein
VLGAGFWLTLISIDVIVGFAFIALGFAYHKLPLVILGFVFLGMGLYAIIAKRSEIAQELRDRNKGVRS